MKLANKYFVKELWTQFKRKIEKEWTSKYSEYGDSLKKANNLTTLATAIHSDITKSLNGRKIKVSNSLIIYNYLKSDTLSDKAHLNTLDMFSAYLGYKNWEEFCENNKSVVEAKLEEQETEFKEITEEDKRWKYLWFIIPVVCLILGGIWWKNSTTFTYVEIDYFKTVIQGANDSELKAYRAVPNIDTQDLDLYFTKDSKARKKITDRVHRKIDSFVLDLGSHYNLLSTKGIYKKNNEIRVETEESWDVKWRNKYTNVLKSTMWTTKQYYILRQNGEKWKIDFNEPLDTVPKPKPK